MPSERFVLESSQTRRTPVVAAFAEGAVSSIDVPEDVRTVVAAVRDSLSFFGWNTLASRTSVNPKVTRRIRISTLASDLHVRLAVPISVAGERTADQILHDGFVPKRFPCTDMNTVILAVLRHHGVACRLARAINADQGRQTSAVEFRMNRKTYVVQPTLSFAEQWVRPGVLENYVPVPDSEYGRVLRSVDHHSSGVDLQKMLASLAGTKKTVDAHIQVSLHHERPVLPS